MKKLLTILFTVLSCVALGQKIEQTIGVKSNIVKALGQMAVDSALLLPKDTIQLLSTDRAIAFKGNNIFQWTGIKWDFIIINGDTLFVDSPLRVRVDPITGHRILFILKSNGLESGGIVTKAACLSLEVTPPTYNIGFRQFVAAATTLAVTSPDASFPRTDEVIADTFGIVSILTGVPSTTPVPISINPSSQIVLSTYTVAAGASCLGIVQESVYDENTEWTTSHGGTMTVNFVNTDNPYHLTKAAFISTYVDGSSLIFTRTGNDTAQASEILKFFIYLNGAFSNQFQVSILNGSTQVGSTVVFNAGYGFNPNDSNQYQNVSIPFSAFNLTNQAFNKIVITFAGSDLSGAKGLYIDYIQLQTGSVNFSSGHGVFNLTQNATKDSIVLTRDDGVQFTVKSGSASGGSSGISKLGVSPYGLTKLNDSTYYIDTTLLLTKLGAAAIYLTANQPITVTATGDATGTSTSSGTAPSLPLVLATVNSNVGTFTNATVTTNGKGLITAISNGSGGSTPNLLNVSRVGNTIDSLNFLRVYTATPPPAHGNVLFDSSGLGWRDSTGRAVILNKGLVTAGSLVVDSFQNKSGVIALLSDTSHYVHRDENISETVDGNKSFLNVGNNFLGYTPNLSANYFQTETAVPDFNNSHYNFTGLLDYYPNGEYVSIIRQGRIHVGDQAGLVMYKSTDQGQNWTTPVSIYNDGRYDARGQAGGVTPKGRLIVFFGRYDTVTSLSHDLGYIYSDDKGVTWSSYTTISNLTNTGYLPYGNMIVGAKDTLIQGWYGNVGTTFSVYIIKSADNGATWSSPITVISDASHQYTEASFIYLSGSSILCVTRTNAGTKFRQLYSADNGTTWTDQGDCAFETSAFIRQGQLCKYITQSGKQAVAFYYCSTQFGKMKAAYGFAADLIAGVSGWSATTVDIATLNTSIFALGYVGAIHPFGNPRGFITYCDQTSTSNSLIRYASVPSTFGSVDPTANSIFSANGIGTTFTPRITLSNTTLSASGLPQNPPSIAATYSGYGTTAGASIPLEYDLVFGSVQSTIPAAVMNFNYKINGGGSTNAFGYNSASGFNVTGVFTSTGAANAASVFATGNVQGNGTGIFAGLQVSGAASFKYRAITALRTLDATDDIIECTSGTFTVTLPTSVGISNSREYWIVNSGSGTITVATTSSQTFVNVTATPTTLTIPQFTNYRVVTNGANWLAFKIVN